MTAPDAKPPTMQDVANAAGVSAMTVSRVLKNNPNVASYTRTRVQNAIAHLRYMPNPLLTALVEQRRRKSDSSRGTVLAYIIDKHYAIGTCGYGYTLFSGARDQARQLGFSLEVFAVGRKPHHERQIDNLLYSRGISGVILAPMPLDISTRCYTFNWERYAAVRLDYGFDGLAFEQVLSDHYHGMRQIMTECVRRQMRKIGLIMGQVFHQRVDHRVQAAYLNGCGKHPIPPLILKAWDNKTFSGWIRRNTPEVVVSSMVFLPQIYAALKHAGLRVPDDVGMISLNTNPEPGGPAFDSKVVSGVDPMARQMGIAAVNRLTAQLFRNERGVPTLASCTTIPTQWVEGDTLSKKPDPAEGKHR